jgi:drug/metabolite transporter (DMT)-like permease
MVLPTNEYGIIVAILAAFCWGVVYAASQRLIQTGKFTSFELLLACFFVGCVLLLPFALYDRHAIMQAEQPNLTRFIWFLITMIAAEYLVFFSVYLLGGTEASLIQVSYPIWTALYLYFANGEKPTTATVAGGTIILIGVCIITLYGGKPHSSTQQEDRGAEIEKGQLLKSRSSSNITYMTTGDK